MACDEKILEKTRAFCSAEGLLGGQGTHIIAAVSGGADSMALLRLLLLLQPECGFELSACHVNHGLRGETADADEAFVRAECARLGVPLRVFRAAELGEIPPHVGEDWARRLRYACFERARAETRGISRVATAHTATDQAETLLFRLARGTGLHGAAGIRPAREGYIRPLLCLTRAETEDLCASLGQRWATDETNDGDAYARNRLRHAALPALRSANSAAEVNLARFCEKAARADGYFEQKASELMRGARYNGKRSALPAAARYALAAGQPVWSLEPLQRADALILEAALHGLTSPVRDAEEKYISLLAALARRGSGAVQLTASVRFCAEGGVFWREETQPERAVPAAFNLPFEPEKQAEYALPNGKKLRARLAGPLNLEKTQGIHKKDLKNQADYAKITTLHPAPVLRCRKAGDKYRPVGRGVEKELRKWMNEAGIPPKLRETLPLIASGSNVLWVCGAGFAEGFAPDAASEHILIVNMEDVES